MNSKRLLAIASLIEDNTKVYDIGCDHALLDIFLAKTKYNISCVAIDNKKKVMDRANKNIKNSNLNNITTVLNDGLKNIDINKDDLVVIAGMGFKTIKRIMENDICKLNKVIIQSNGNVSELRDFLTKNHFTITNEVLVYESNKYYVVISVIKKYTILTEEDIVLGPILKIDNSIKYINYLNHSILKLNKQLNDIKIHNKKYQTLNTMKNIIEKYINKRH